jgi:putative flavoprotein involved in K+ transport
MDTSKGIKKLNLSELMKMRQVDVLIIGASQAGLAIGYQLKKTNKSYTIIGKENRIGDVWRNRYDSLVLFTPRWYSSLPGLALRGDQNGYATKDEIADYLEEYADLFELPVHLQTKVLSLKKLHNLFSVATNHGEYWAKKVVVSTGPFQKPAIPKISSVLSNQVYQVHTSQYLNPSQLKPGSVLVVGAGNSGAQIAVELSKDRDVYLSIGHKIKFFPLQSLGKSIFWWFDKFGILKANVNSKIGSFLSKQSDPIFGKELTNQVKQERVRLLPRTKSILDDIVTFENNNKISFDNVIWATGFRADYSWIQLPNITNNQGKPIHERGISSVEGLFFLGLPWQHTRGSALIGGVGDDAEYLAKQI